jgi:hypothetical protein
MCLFILLNKISYFHRIFQFERADLCTAQTAQVTSASDSRAKIIRQ